MRTGADAKTMNPDQASVLSFVHISTELRLYQGGDSLAALARELQRCRCQRAVVLCGRTLAGSEVMEPLRHALGPALAGVWSGVRQHSPVRAVEEAARYLAQLDADAVVAVGGGSAAVTGRAAAILLAEKKPARELCTRRLADGQFDSPRLGAAKLPQFVVATTPSTAFVKAGSAIHDETGARLALFDPKTRARAIFIHPQFLATAPEELVRSASLNTLATAVEALSSSRCDPVSEALLVHALRLVVAELPALSRPGLGARENLAVAAVLCGRGTEQVGGGLASVLAHAIGHRSLAANGVVNAIVLPHTMRFNEAVATRRSRSIVDGLRVAGAAACEAQGAGEASSMIESMLSALPVPHRLREIGVSRQDLGSIATAAMGDWFIGRNPRPVSHADEVLAILDAAW